MRRTAVLGTLAGFSLTALGALGQGAAPTATPPKAPAPAPAPAPKAAASASAPAAPAPAPSAAPPAAAPTAAAAAPAAQPAPSPPPPAPTTAPSAAAPVAAESAAPPASPPPPAPPPAATPAVAARSNEGAATPPPGKDRGPEETPSKKAYDPWQDAHAIALEGVFFVGGRLGPSSIEPAEENRVGLGFDFSGWLTLSEEYVLGLGITRADLGSVSAGSGSDTFEGEYALTSAYLGARAFPYRKKDFEVFIGLRIGLAWQDLDASGLKNPDPNVAAPVVYSCSGSAGPDFAIGAGFGAAYRLGSRTWLNGHVDANGYQLSSDLINNCAIGIGSVTNVSVGAGLLYAFDLGAEQKLEAGSRPSRP